MLGTPYRQPWFEDDAVDLDALMMLSAKRGDMHSLEVLVNKHRGPVIRYVNRMVRDEAISEELAQEVFLRVHRYREGYEITAKFTTWLYRIACRLALNWIRDHERERYREALESPRDDRPVRQYTDPAMRIDDWLVTERKYDEVRRAVHQLPERQRMVVLMHKFDGLSCEEIAATLGCSRQAVRSLLCRAYMTLRIRLAHIAPHPGTERTQLQVS